MMHPSPQVSLDHGEQARRLDSSELSGGSYFYEKNIRF